MLPIHVMVKKQKLIDYAHSIILNPSMDPGSNLGSGRWRQVGNTWYKTKLDIMSPTTGKAFIKAFIKGFIRII